MVHCTIITMVNLNTSHYSIAYSVPCMVHLIVKRCQESIPIIYHNQYHDQDSLVSIVNIVS